MKKITNLIFTAIVVFIGSTGYSQIQQVEIVNRPTYQDTVNQGLASGQANAFMMMQAKRARNPRLDPPARIKDKYGHSAQYYSDKMYTASKAGLTEEAAEYRAKMKALYAIDLAEWERKHKKN